MGAEQFDNFAYGSESITGASAAFTEAVSMAKYDYGHSGYTGTIAEKSEYVLVGKVETQQEAYDLMDDRLYGDDRVNDKWGPAGCIEVAQPAGWLFFGWASS